MAKNNKQKEIMLGLGKETAQKGMSVNPKCWLAETSKQVAIRDFIFEVGKSWGLLWLIPKIKFLKYKDWVRIRIEEIEWRDNGKK